MASLVVHLYLRRMASKWTVESEERGALVCFRPIDMPKDGVNDIRVCTESILTTDSRERGALFIRHSSCAKRSVYTIHHAFILG